MSSLRWISPLLYTGYPERRVGCSFLFGFYGSLDLFRFAHPNSFLSAALLAFLLLPLLGFRVVFSLLSGFGLVGSPLCSAIVYTL